MLDSNIILGIRGNLNCEEYDHGILIQNWEDMPLGAPVTYGKGVLEDDTARVMSLISPSQQAAGKECTNIYSRLVMPVGLKSLCSNHKVLTVDQLDANKFSRLIEFIRDMGSVSFVIGGEEGKKNLTKELQKLNNVFKYSTLFYYNTWGGKYLAGKDDIYACVLTFFDLPYCIPLFNMRKVDGIGLSISGATVNQSIRDGVLQKTFRTDFIYSNHEDNLLVIDGVSVNEYRPLTSSIFNEVANRVNMKLEEGKPLSQKKKEKKSDYGYGKDIPSLKSPTHDWPMDGKMTVEYNHGSLAVSYHGQPAAGGEVAHDAPVPSPMIHSGDVNTVISNETINFSNEAVQYITTTDGMISVSDSTDSEGDDNTDSEDQGQ